MIATTTVEDLESSLQKCLERSDDLSTQMAEQTAIVDQAQSEIRTIESQMQVRAEQYNRLLPLERSALEALGRAQDLCTVATGAIRTQSEEDLRIAQEALDEIRQQMLDIQKAQAPANEQDQVLLESIHSRISDANTTYSQLASQQGACGQTRDALRLRLGESLFRIHSGALEIPRAKQAALEKELAQNAGVYSQMRKDASEQLRDYPELLRKLKQENDLADDSDVKALMLFIAFCEYVAANKTKDTRVFELFEIDSYNLAGYDGGINTLLFEEKARQCRNKLAELNHQ